MRIPHLAILTTLLGILLAGCAAEEPRTPDTDAPTGDRSAPPRIVREDFQTFTLGPRQDIEWKYRLAEGAEMEYSWTATRPARFDFHGDRDDGTDAFVSHKKSTLASDAGTFIAPFAGRHGWYFHNGNAQTITIELSVEGEFELVGRTGGNAP